MRRMTFRPISRYFDLAHNVSQANPWRGTFDCSDTEISLVQMAVRTRHRDPNTPPAGHRQYDWACQPMKATKPERLFREFMTQLTKEEVDKIRRKLTGVYRSGANDGPIESLRYDERWLYPARRLLVDQS